MALNKDEILDAIAGMTVLELSELIKQMEEKFGVSAAAATVAANPVAFVRRVLKGFQANQGLLLAGAVAYYSLLSVRRRLHQVRRNAPQMTGAEA